MNRWEVQFTAWLIPATVTAPTAADALIVAAAVYRRTYPSIPEGVFGAPMAVKWLGGAELPKGAPNDGHVELIPGSATSSGAAERSEFDAAASKWRGPCRVCKEIVTAEELEASHRHEDDPRSNYYVAPETEPPPAPNGAANVPAGPTPQ